VSKLEKNLSQGSVAKQLILFALPILFTNIIQSLYSVADMIIVGQFAGTLSMSGVNIGGQVTLLFTNMVIGLAIGGTVLIGQYLSSNQRDALRETIGTMLTTLVVVALVITVAMIWLKEPVLDLIKTPEESYSEALDYFTVTMLGTIFIFVYNGLSAIMRGMGDSRTPLIFVGVACAINVVLDLLLVAVLKTGAWGAAVATVFSQAVSAILCMIYLRKNRFVFDFRLQSFRPKMSRLKMLLRIGIPISVESVFVQVGYLVANSMAVSLGTYLCGVYQIVNTLNTFVTLPQGICATVALSAAGHLLGAGRPREARLGGRIIWVGGVAATAVLGGIMLLGGTAFTGLYTDDPTAAAAAAGLLWIPLVMDVAGLSINAIDSQLRAGGDVRFVMAVTLTAVWGIRLPLTWLFCFRMDMGVAGIFLANTVSLYFRAILGFARHCTDRWTVRKI